MTAMGKTQRDAARRALGEHLGEVHLTITVYDNGYRIAADECADAALTALAGWAKELLAAALRAKMNEYERTTANNIS